MSDSPKVMVLLDFHPPESKERNFYASKGQNNDFLNYVDTGTQKGVPKDFIAYAGNPEKSEGAFDSEGLLDDEKKKKLREELRNTGSIIWDMVISLREDYGKDKFKDWKECQEILKKNLPDFFQSVGFNSDNMSYFAGLHQNTDNPHIHLAFWEKKPNTVTSRSNKPRFKTKGKLDLKAITAFQMEVEKTLDKDDEIKLSSQSRALRKELCEISNDIPSDLDNGLRMRKLLKKLYRELPDKNKGYASDEMTPYRETIDEITLLILDSHPNLKKAYTHYYSELKKRDEKTIDKLKRAKFKGDISSFLKAEKASDDFFRRLGNKVLNHVYEARSKQLSDEYKISKDQRMRWTEKKRKSYLFGKTLKLDKQVSEEAMDCFEEFERLINKAEYERLVDQGIIERE